VDSESGMKRQDRIDGLKAVRGSHGSPKKEKSGQRTFCLLTTCPNGCPFFGPPSLPKLCTILRPKIEWRPKLDM
jgi:hypothetical protein